MIPQWLSTADNKILIAIMEHQVWPFHKDIVITISGGTATGKGDSDVLKQADDNLYHSKENGRNQITQSI